jgi:hypothetical protein
MPIETYSFSLTVLPFTLAVCRMPPNSPLPVWAAETRLLSLTRTEDELSLVCEEALVPAGVQCEPGWRALKVAGPLDFSLTGVLSSLLAPLAQAGVSIFAISTYDTDYLLVKEADLNEAVAALRGAGHQVSAG